MRVRETLKARLDDVERQLAGTGPIGWAFRFLNAMRSLWTVLELVKLLRAISDCCDYLQGVIVAKYGQ